MRKILLVTAIMVLALTVGQANAAPINAGFETGDMSGWTLLLPPGASANVVTSHTGWAAGSLTYGPVEGSYFLELKADGPGSYTTLSQTMTLGAGSALSGWAAFDSNDYVPFNDNAYVKILDSYGIVIATPWYEDIASNGNYVDTPWSVWSWTAPSAGLYTLQYGITNGGDSILDSYALFDTTTAAVPEPATFLLIGSGLVGLGFMRRKLKV